jgi:hypothetical protein
MDVNGMTELLLGLTSYVIAGIALAGCTAVKKRVERSMATKQQRTGKDGYKATPHDSE